MPIWDRMLGRAGPPVQGQGRTVRATAVAALIVVGLVAGCDSAEERAAEHFENAMALLDEGATVKATLELRNALKLDAKHARAHLELGKLREAEGNYSAALAHYTQVTGLDESLWEGHLRYGRIMLAANNLEEALSASNTAYQLRPQDVDVLLLKATVAFRLDNRETAEATLATAQDIAPDNPESWLLRAALFRADDDREGALGAIERGYAANPDHLGLGLSQVSLLAELERVDDATAALSELVARHPDNTGLREVLIRRQVQIGDMAGAEANLRKLAEQNPEQTARALDVVRFLMRVKGREAGMEELARLIDAQAEPEAAWPYVAAKISLLQATGEAGAAEALLRETATRLGTSPAGNEARIALARYELGAGKRDEARAIISDILKADTRNAGALILRARMEIDDQSYDAAINDLRSAIAEAPDNVEALQLLAVAHRRNGNRQLAGERLADAVEVSKQAPGPVLDYAQHLIRERKPEFAESLIEDALQRRPNDRRLLEALASLKLRRQDWVGADEIAQRLEQIGPEDDLGDRISSAVAAGRGEFDTSLDLLSAAIADKAERNLAALVTANLRAGKQAEAEALIAEALARNPSNPDALRLDGAMSVAKGDRPAAEAAFRRAIEAAPEQAQSYAALARLHGMENRLGDAETVLREGIGRSGNTGLMMTLAVLLERTGRVEAAIGQYREVFRRRPDFDVAANNLASLLTDSDPTPEEMDEAFLAAKRLRGSDVPQFQDTYGWLLHLRGESAKALTVLEQAAEGLPEHPLVQYHLGVVLAELGETERAREVLQRALDLAGDQVRPPVDRARSLLSELPAPAPAQ